MFGFAVATVGTGGCEGDGVDSEDSPCTGALASRLKDSPENNNALNIKRI